jgi:hypothetical protein
MLDKYKNQTLLAIKKDKELMEVVKDNSLRLEGLPDDKVEITMGAANCLFSTSQPFEKAVAEAAAEKHNVSVGEVFQYFYKVIDCPEDARGAVQNIINAKKAYYGGLKEAARNAVDLFETKRK